MKGPAPTPPKKYVLAGDSPSEPPASVALAVIGEMLSEAEQAYERSGNSDNGIRLQVVALQEARRRITEAEAVL